MKKAKMAFVTVLLASALTTGTMVGTVHAEVSKSEWIEGFVRLFPDAMCDEKDMYYCFNLTKSQCDEAVLHATKLCIMKVEEDMPSAFDRDSGEKWGEKIGRCAGELYGNIFKSKKKSGERCSDF